MSKLASVQIIKNIRPIEGAEGLVWRCIEDNTSFKVINNKYLLKEK